VKGIADASLPFIALSISILAIIGLLLLIAGKKGTEQNSTYLPRPCSVYFYILGIVLGSDRHIGYAFLGAGVIIAIFNAVKNRQKK
jgi:uncharacterized membrane protein